MNDGGEEGSTAVLWFRSGCGSGWIRIIFQDRRYQCQAYEKVHTFPTKFSYAVQNALKKIMQCCGDPGSGAFLTLDPEYGIGFFPDPGSRIPNPYFWKLKNKLLDKWYYNSLAKQYSLPVQK